MAKMEIQHVPGKLGLEDFTNEVQGKLFLIRDAVVRGCHRGALHAERIISHDTPVDMGQARNAWYIRELPGVGYYVLNDSPYIGVLEYGRRSYKGAPHHYPPIAPIVEWLKRRLRTVDDAENSALQNAKRTKKAMHASLKKAKKDSRDDQMPGKRGKVVRPMSLSEIYEEELKRIAFMISQKIGNNGTKPHYMVLGNWSEIKMVTISEVKKEVRRLKL